MRTGSSHSRMEYFRSPKICTSATPGTPLERISDVNVQVVAHEQRGIFVLVGNDRRAKDEVLRTLGRRYADGLHRGGQTSLRRVDSVLDVDRSQVWIAVQIECGRDAARSIVAAGGGHILHPLRAVDLLLQRNGDRAFHSLGAGPDVSAGNAYLRRRQVGKLRDRQRGNDRSARQNNQQRADRGEHRTTYKKFNEHRRSDCGLSAKHCAISQAFGQSTISSQRSRICREDTGNGRLLAANCF
jgi:hypothetical protein